MKVGGKNAEKYLKDVFKNSVCNPEPGKSARAGTKSGKIFHEFSSSSSFARFLSFLALFRVAGVWSIVDSSARARKSNPKPWFLSIPRFVTFELDFALFLP